MNTLSYRSTEDKAEKARGNSSAIIPAIPAVAPVVIATAIAPIPIGAVAEGIALVAARKLDGLEQRCSLVGC